MKRFVHCALLLLIAIQSTPAFAQSQERMVDHGAFDRILRDNVRDERVDYLTIRDHHWDQLEAYLDQLAKVEPAKLDKDEQLALYINLYNATMIAAVIERFEAEYSPSDDDFTVFDEKLVRTANGRMSLNHLEHEIIRKQFNEPRIHVALVCAARSCPPLLNRAYRTVDLEELLEIQMRKFINDKFRNRVDRRNKTLRLSQIFNWYDADFGGKKKLAQYIARYLNRDVSGYRVEFMPYSWTLNIAKPQEGNWFEIAHETKAYIAPNNSGEAATLLAKQVYRRIEQRESWTQLHLGENAGSAWVANTSIKPYKQDN